VVTFRAGGPSTRLQLTLTRDTPHPELWLGILEVAGRKFHTLESADCLPAGTYRLRQHQRPNGEQCFALVAPQLGVFHQPYDIPPSRQKTGRYLALVHAGNYFWDAGAVALGKDRVLDTIRGPNTFRTWKMAETKSAMNELRTLIGTKFDVEMTIVSSMEAQAIG
jgi:hypothetical protein